MCHIYMHCLSICPSSYSSCLSVYLSIYLSVYLPIYLSISLSISLSICLSLERIETAQSAAEDSSIYIYIHDKYLTDIWFYIYVTYLDFKLCNISIAVIYMMNIWFSSCAITCKGLHNL